MCVYLHLCLEFVCVCYVRKLHSNCQNLQVNQGAISDRDLHVSITLYTKPTFHTTLIVHAYATPTFDSNWQLATVISSTYLSSFSGVWSVSATIHYSSLGGCARISCAYCIMPWSASCAFASTFAVNLCHAAQAQSSLKTPLEQRDA